MPSYLFPFPASRRSTTFWALMFTLLLVGTDSRCFAQDGFTNWESPHVHPLDLTPSEERLLAVNTPDARLEVFDVSTGTPVLIDSIPVGLDPVSVRARTDSEVWVVNHVSDSVSIVDLELGTVVHTLETEDEPADVVFAANGRAFVSCSQANSVLVFDAANRSLVDVVPIAGEDPRALAVSPNGNVIYCAIFESGNASTLVRGGRSPGFRGYDGVDDEDSPYAGQNPPPNDGENFFPPINPDLPAPPRVSMIVKRDADDRWLDDNNGDWTNSVRPIS